MTNRWLPADALPLARDHLGVVAFNGKVYAIGGRIDSARRNVARTDIYDPNTDTWSSGAPMPTARSGVAAAVFGDRILIIGGESPARAFDTNEAYDPVRNAWTRLAPLPSPRHGTGAATIGDALYLPAGAPRPGGSQSNTLFIFAGP